MLQSSNEPEGFAESISILLYQNEINRLSPQIKQLCGIKSKAAISLTFDLHCKAKSCHVPVSVLSSYLRTLPNWLSKTQQTTLLFTCNKILLAHFPFASYYLSWTQQTTTCNKTFLAHFTKFGWWHYFCTV